jgi:integrase
MGRKRSSAKSSALPRYVYRLRRTYFFRSPLPPRKWISLGSDLSRALAHYAVLLSANSEEQRGSHSSLVEACVAIDTRLRPTLKDLWDRYEVLALPEKAPVTSSGNRGEVVHLLAVFGSVAVDDISAVDVRKYLDLRGAVAPVRANREIALLSHMLNRGREWGLVTVPNPCAGVRKFAERGRDRYVTDEEYLAVWQAGDALVRDVMALAYLTGQRPQDVFSITVDQVLGDVIPIFVKKTKQRIRLEISGALKLLIDDLKQRFRKPGALTLLVNEKGEAATANMFRFRFDHAREAAGVEFQLRDLRAKNASDTEDLSVAQKRLAHTSRAMTEHYVRIRQGERVGALNRVIVGATTGDQTVSSATDDD